MSGRILPLSITSVCFSLAAVCCPAYAQQFLSPAPPPASPNAPAPASPSAPLAAPVSAEPPLAISKNFHIAPSVVQPTLPGKVSYYLSSTVSMRNVGEALLIAGVPNITSAPSQPIAPSDPTDTVAAGKYERAMEIYGDEMDSWRRTNDVTMRYHAARLETGFATAETRQVLSNLVLPIALQQRARYLPAPAEASLGERLWNAASSIVVTRNDAGYLVPNYSKLGGTVGAAFLGKALYANAFNAPELDSNHFVFSYIGYSLLGDLATNTAHELVRAAAAPDLAMYGMHGGSQDDSYYPLSIGGKLIYWGRSTYSIRNFIEGALMAGVPQVTDQPVEPQPGVIITPAQALAYNEAYIAWGSAELAWKDNLEQQLRYREHAFLGGLSESETQMFLGNLLLPVALDMDPRYLPLGPGHPVTARLGHAMRGLVFTHTDSGNTTVNAPLLGGTVGAAFLAKELYYPQLGTTSLESGSVLAKTISLNLVADAIGNVYREFFNRRSY